MNRSIATISVIALFLAFAGIVSADACSIKDLCYNQDGKPFCSPSDSSCTYKTYTIQGNACTGADELTDVDNDGWTVSCDADDADADKQVDFGDEDDSAESENESENRTDEQSDGSNDGRNGGLDNVGVIRLIIQNSSTDDNGEEGSQEEQSNPIIVASNSQDSDGEDADAPATIVTPKDAPAPLPTGMVTDDLSGRTSWSAGFYAFIALIIVALLLFFLLAKKKN